MIKLAFICQGSYIVRGIHYRGNQWWTKINFPNKQLIVWRTRYPRCSRSVRFSTKNLPNNTEGEKHQLTMPPRALRENPSEDPNLSYSGENDGKLNQRNVTGAYTRARSALLPGTKQSREWSHSLTCTHITFPNSQISRQFASHVWTRSLLHHFSFKGFKRNVQYLNYMVWVLGWSSGRAHAMHAQSPGHQTNKQTNPRREIIGNHPYNNKDKLGVC